MLSRDVIESKVSPISGLNVLRVIFLIVISISITRTAWISDDALITLRSVLNISHGWGSGFNATESVQAYTHPMWMLIWLIAGSFSSEWIFSIFLISIILSTVAAAIILFTCRSKTQVLFVGLALLLSNSFIDYATSGLENPLAYLLVVLAITISLRREFTLKWVAVLALVLSFLVLTRFDFAILVFPVAIYLLFSWRKRPAKLAVALTVALVPILIWFSWSFITYSSLLPNTFAAKSNLDIPRFELMAQGLQYLWVLFRTDLITAVVLTLGSIFVALYGSALQRLWIVGVLGYLSYVVFVGGDFMAGRFFAVPFLAVLLLTVLVPCDRYYRFFSRRKFTYILTSIAVLVVTIAFLSGPTPFSTTQVTAGQRFEQVNGIIDERAFYTRMKRTFFDLFDSKSIQTEPFTFPIEAIQQPDVHVLVLNEAADSWPRKSANTSDYPIAVGDTCGIGATAIMAGPEIHWVDSCALADRFLASVPFAAPEWRIGHFVRAIPEGYLNAILQNDPTLLVDESESIRLQELWSEIK